MLRWPETMPSTAHGNFCTLHKQTLSFQSSQAAKTPKPDTTKPVTALGSCLLSELSKLFLPHFAGTHVTVGSSTMRLLSSAHQMAPTTAECMASLQCRTRMSMSPILLRRDMMATCSHAAQSHLPLSPARLQDYPNMHTCFTTECC